ncbi:unnamed protein product [Symbiodinium sp. CCMP2592]|nr:unnamed protein product [Symbiodinium sp. CCMP2592]
MDVYRIGQGPFRGLICVYSDDDALEIFQRAKNLACECAGLASTSEAKESHPHELQQLLKTTDFSSCHWQYLETADARGLGLGSNKQKYSRAAFLALALDKARHAHSAPSILREALESLRSAADLEHARMRTSEPRTSQGQKRSRASADGGEGLSHREYFEQLWADCVETAGGRRLPDTLQMQHIAGMRAQGLWVGRKKAHSILMAARGMMHEELPRSSKDVLVEELDTQPWQLVVAGASDKILESLIGPGIKAFRIEMRRKDRCPYTKDPMSVFVAERVDGWRVIHHPHAHKDEELRFEDDQNQKMYEPAFPTRDEMTRAFRLATDWSVRNRWRAFQVNVFQQLLHRFQEDYRPGGFQLTDFRRGEGGSVGAFCRHRIRLSALLARWGRTW